MKKQKIGQFIRRAEENAAHACRKRPKKNLKLEKGEKKTFSGSIFLGVKSSYLTIFLILLFGLDCILDPLNEEES